MTKYFRVDKNILKIMEFLFKEYNSILTLFKENIKLLSLYVIYASN